MVSITDEEFEQLVVQAIDSLPDPMRAYLKDVVIDIEAMPDRATARSVGLRSRRRLLGLFHGVPITHQSVMDAPRLSNRISIYRDNIRRMCRRRSEIVEQVRKTVLHEIGHHFGLDEGDLDELGYG
jgi:predicted Zn-dependent protease with MMP-like domain